MKKKRGVFIIVLVSVIVMGGMHPTLLFSGASGQGNLWDFLIDPGPSTGTKWSGPLSIYYKFTGINCSTTGGYDPEAYLYFTVRLGHQGVAPYPYYGASSGPICQSDIDPGQGTALRLFLNDALSDIYSKISGCPPNTICVVKDYYKGDWKLKSIQNATYIFISGDVDGTFVADIQIAVNE